MAKAAADRNPTNAGIRDGYLGMRARLISDTGQWEKLTLAPPAAAHAGADHAAMPGMPGMGGLELLRTIRRGSANMATPILVVSMLADDVTVERCRAAGADAHLAKPVEDRRLLAAVKKLLAERGKSRIS